MEIKSSYRFVPVEKNQQFFSPGWKNQVSQDIPFKDSLSGKISYTLTANTALLIKDQDGKFCQVNGEYFIPGTSIKGCIRSVLEIMSFGHLDDTRVQDNKNDKFAFRDIQDRDGYMQKMSDVYCGFLTADGKIVNWGKPVNIKYDDLQRIFPNYHFASFRNMDVCEKYTKAGKKVLKGKFSEPRQLPGAKHFDKRKFTSTSNGVYTGCVIFSGAMQNKKSDFVLLDKDTKTRGLIVSDTVLNSFKAIYGESLKGIPSDNAKGGKPVFFTKDKNGNVLTIGLSFLHKYFAHNSIRDAIPANMQGKNPDLADVMFGSVKYESKGRVQFSHAKAITAEPLLKEGDSILTVLGSPRASYYPIYLQDYATWDTNGCTISGIKRYPIKPRYDISVLDFKNLSEKEKKDYEEKYGQTTGTIYETTVEGRELIPRDATNDAINFDTTSMMTPLKEGAVFKGSIQFHNLKPEELGALLSALTFHGKEKECKHSLGHAKSQGYGSVSINIDSIKVNQIECQKEEFLQKYESTMNDFIRNECKKSKSWLNTEQIKELFAMAKGFDDRALINTFTSMELEEFGKAKGNYMRHRDFFSNYTDAILNKAGVRQTQQGYRTINNPYPNVQRHAGQNTQKQPQYEKAKVVFLNNQLKVAQLLNSKDASRKELAVFDKTVKLKIGDEILVEKIMTGGNVKKLKFVKKL